MEGRQRGHGSLRREKEQSPLERMAKGEVPREDKVSNYSTKGICLLQGDKQMERIRLKFSWWNFTCPGRWVAERL